MDKKASTVGPLLLLLGFKAARAAMLFHSFDWLHVRSVPAVALSCFLLTGLALLLLVVVKPWQGSALLRLPTLLAHALLLALNVWLWNLGLAALGPLK